MIHITSKEQCVGCNACVQRCPKACIAMEEDHEGFLYPKIDHTICIDCGICEKVCPVIHQAEPPKEEPATYACYNKNEEIRKQSSSGGIFTLLAETVLAKNGVVFGARFDENFDVIHDYTETVEGLKAFRGSKYVQSRIGETYMQAERFLKEGREVLFSGTPCQIAGLKRFLRKEYSNLLSVDFICHGVPSPKVWHLYLNELSKGDLDTVRKVNFRYKKPSWRQYSILIDLSDKIVLQRSWRNSYLKGFISNLYLRPSCSYCPAKGFKSKSDFTIGDHWGAISTIPEFDDNKGLSIVYISSNQKFHYFESIEENIIHKNIDFISSTKANHCLYSSVIAHKDRFSFFESINSADRHYFKLTKCVSLYCPESFRNKIKAYLFELLHTTKLINLLK